MKTADLDTPCVVIEDDIVLRNIERTQQSYAEHGIAFRPHIKTHKLLKMAQRQMDAGAVGLNCQKLSEAEVFVNAGFTNILLTYNILGDAKLKRLYALSKRCDLTVVADNATVVEGLGAAFDADGPLKVLVECDTGAGRCGVQTPEEAADLAQMIACTPGLTFQGLMTYPPTTSPQPVENFMLATTVLLKEKGLGCPVVTSGGTPLILKANKTEVVNEYRAGTYIYNDRSQIRAGACELKDCALTVLATVVSRPTSTRAIIDAGSKALSSDLYGLKDHGELIEYPEIKVSSLSEEHGNLFIPEGVEAPKVGERVHVLPNHACVVSNLFDEVHLVRGDTVLSSETVVARGKVW